MPLSPLNTSGPASIQQAALHDQLNPKPAQPEQTSAVSEPGSQSIYAKSAGAAAAVGIRGNVGKGTIPESIAKTWMSKEIFLSKDFPKQNIGQFVASQFNISSGEVEESLYNALPKVKQTPTARAFIQKGMKNSVNASGAVMLCINTDEGIKIVVANSQRRKMVTQSNGACEKGESMKETGMREAFEELGNPSPQGILASVLADDNNCRSTIGTNKVGDTLQQIAEKMVDNEGKKKGYINASSVYMNQDTVSAKALQAELNGLSEGVAAMAKYYNPCVEFMFGKKKDAFKAENIDSVIEASAIVTGFQDQFPGAIPSTFSDVFANFSKDPLDAKRVKAALEAIIDLTENDKIMAISLVEIEDKAAQFVTDKDALKKTTFAPSIEAFQEHAKAGAFAHA